MRHAWCPKHRGVMRISFFDPSPEHFYNPCPRCGEDLNYAVRTKYEILEESPTLRNKLGK